MELNEGFICDPASNTCGPAAGAPERTHPTAWLPTEKLAEAWRAIHLGHGILSGRNTLEYRR